MIPPRPPGPWFVGLDIETDTATDGLDPRVSRILSWSIAGVETSVVYLARVEEVEDSAITGLLSALHGLSHQASVESPLVITTWNGSAFDWPFIHTRLSKLVDESPTIDLDYSLWPFRLHLSDDRVPKYEPIGDHPGGYRVDFPLWPNVFHLDVAFALKGYCEENDLSWSLKAVMDHQGMARPKGKLAEKTAELPHWLLAGYNLSDAEATRSLGLFAADLYDLGRIVDAKVP